jgi:hypothetical protein
MQPPRYWYEKAEHRRLKTYTGIEKPFLDFLWYIFCTGSWAISWEDRVAREAMPRNVQKSFLENDF